jgi:Ni/Fe-hydrogenase 1 B-type cytochrome subunit
MTAASDAIQPGAIPEESVAVERIPVYVWERPVRASHWLTAGCIVVLSVTGGYIADPFLIPPGGAVMTTVRLVHMGAAFTLLASGLLRTIWLLLGNRFARWSAFFPTTVHQATEAVRQALFYSFLRPHPPKVLGHNQLAAGAYILLWALLLLETVTGFALDGLIGSEPGASFFWWLRELFGAQSLRVVHHLSMWAILAISFFHIYSSVLVDHIEKNGLVASIFNGYKFVARREILEARDGGEDLLEAER